MIRHSVQLALSLEAAFELFTTGISEWWPPENRHLGDRASTLHLQETGRFFERATDGREVELGLVLEWDAPRFLLLDFYVATGPAHPTRVEVRFEQVADGTVVEVTHSPTGASEALWEGRVHRYVAAWQRVLAALEVAAGRAGEIAG